MTDLVLAPSDAGWYPDPEGVAAFRFWDGAAWTLHIKGGPARVAPPTAGAVHVAPMVGVPRNGLATAGLVLGIVSLLLNVLLIPSILGVVLGAVGASRAVLRGGVGRARAITGIVLSALGVVAVGVQLAVLVPLVLGLQHQAQMAQVRSAVVDGAAARNVRITDVTCPATANLRVPGTFTCGAGAATGERFAIAVMVAPDGTWTWRAESVG